jgi:hypothetical protein
MLDNLQPIKVGWYDWDYRLAVVAGQHAYVLCEKRGWRKVNPVDVGWDGIRFSSVEDAIERYRLIWDGIDPTIVATHIVRGIAPPKPRLYRRFFLVESGIALEGRDDFTGNILVEFDDGSMRKINGRELNLLADRYPRLKQWRLTDRDAF